jgi:hypothetical protein
MTSEEREGQVSHMRGVLSNPSYKGRIILLEPGRRDDKAYGLFDALFDWMDVSTGGNAFWDAESEVTVDELAGR